LIDVHTALRDWTKVALKTNGEHQARNCAISLSLIEHLKTTGISISDEAVYSALSQWSLPLRVEVLLNKPVFIVDAAHNVASIQALLETIEEKGPYHNKTLIFASTQGKDALKILEQLVPEFDRVILTEYKNNPRSIPLKELEECLLKVSAKPFEVAQTPQDALQRAMENHDQNDLICTTGSFFIAAEMRNLVQVSQPTGCSIR